MHSFQGHNEEVFLVALSPDGRFIASGGDGEAIVLWKVDSRSFLTTFTQHSCVIGLTFSPDNSILAFRDCEELKLISLF